MSNKIIVTISGTEYTLMSEDSAAYMQKVAALVDEKMNDITAAGRVSRMDAAVLTAVNLADELLKQQTASENIRRQLKGYLDDANRAKTELGECKRELLKLQQQNQQMQKQNQPRQQNQQNQPRQHQQNQTQPSGQGQQPKK